MDPTITPDNITTMGDGDDPAPTANTIKAEFDAAMVTTSLSATATAYTVPAEDESFLTFTAEAKPTYQITSVKYVIGDAPGKKDAVREDETTTYKIPKADLTGNIVVTIAAEKIKHTITVTCPEQVAFAITNEGLTLNEQKKVEVDEGTTFGFTAKLTAAAKNTHKITEVSCTPEGGEKKNLVVKDSGQYSIGNIEKDLAIAITVEEIPTFDVTFTTHDNVEKIAEIKLDGAAADPAEITGETDWKIARVPEDTVVSFKVAAKEFYKVKTVKAGTTPLNARNDVYTFRPTEDTKDITIETELDPAQCYALDLNIVGDADSATVTLSMPTNAEGAAIENADGASASLVFPPANGGAFVTQNAKLHIKVAPKANYALSKTADNKNDVTITPAVEGAELTPTADKADEWDITLVTGKTVTLQVKTEAAELASDKAVTFINNAKDDMTLAVTTSDKVEKDATETTNEKYSLKSGLKTLDFTITAKGALVPTVTNRANDTIAYKSVSRNTEDNTRTYSYSLNAGTLADAEEITIGKTDSKAKLTFVYDEDQTEITVKQGSTEVTLTDKAVEIDEGDTVTVEAAAKINCRITKIETKAGEETKTIIAPKGGTDFHTFILANVDSDTIVTITSASASYAKSLKAGAEAVTPDAKGVYSVTDSVAYTAAVMTGVDTKVALSKFELKDGSNVVAPTTGEGDNKVVNYTTRFLAGDEDVTITLKDVLAGRTLTLNLYDDPSGDAAAKVIATYTLKVQQRLDNVSIQINKNKNIQQKADTVGYYVVDAKGADANSITAEVFGTNDDVVAAAGTKIEDGKLTVKTGFGVNKTTKLKFYYTDKDGKKQYVKNGTDDLELEVKALPVVTGATKAPGVKLTSATDVSLTLSLDAKAAKLPATTATGKVYYAITVTPKATVEGKTRPASIVSSAFTKYVPASTTEKVLYVGTDTSDSGKPALGTGGAWDFDVAVKLVHVKSALADENTAPAADAVVKDGDNACESIAFTTGNKPFSTKALAYETKLGLNKTKAAGAVYTTQENVTVATPKWSTDTSYRKLSGAEDITQGLDETHALDVAVVNDEVQVSASTETALGKHTIEVYASYDSAGEMYAARATVVVNVVRGIEDLTMTVPTTELYQAENKSASLKAAVSYNEGLNADTYGAKNIVPKTKKVNWYFVSKDVENVAAVNGDTVKSTELAGGLIKIDKNGKVSVDKKYQINAATSSFKILAEAADFEGNNVKALSEKITITRKGISLNAAAIVSAESGSTVVKAVTGGTAPTLEAGELDGLTLVGLMPGLSAAANGTYGDSTFNNYKIDENLTYTSSNKKAVEVSKSGLITVKAPAKNVKLTVATADGTNIKKDVIVTVRYDDNSGTLGLAIEKDVKAGDNTPEATWTAKALETAPAISFYDSAAAYFNLKVQEKEDPDNADSWRDIPEFTNYKISVNGGKILSETDGVTNIVVDKKAATVKLEYTHYNAETKKDVKKTKTYTLTNAGYSAQGLAKAPKITFLNKISSIKAVVDGGDYSRSIGFTLQPNGNNYPINFTEGKTVNEDGTFDKDIYYRVDVDGAAITAKNKDAIKKLADSMGPTGYCKLNEDYFNGGIVRLGFDDSALTPGSYKLKVGVGTVDDKGNFVLAAEPANISIKVVADKKLSFKPTAAYKISAKNGTVALTGKASDSSVSYTFKNLQNANVNDKKQGEVNAFTTYFALVDNTLKLQDACFNADGTLKEIAPKDLFGYVDYEAGYAYTADYDKIKGTTKITVKIQDNAIIKYAVSNASASQAINSVANVTVTANKQPVAIAYAAVEAADAGTWQTVARKADGSVGDASAAVNGSTITLQHTDAITDKASAKVTLKVIPDDSLYKAKVAALLTAAGTDATKLAAVNDYIKTNGVELKTTITLKDMDDAKTTKRIAVDAKNTTLNFTANWRVQGNLSSVTARAESGYDPTHSNYWIDVPVTDLFDGAGASIKDITVVKTEHNMFSFDYNTEVERGDTDESKVKIPCISIALNKSALKNAEALRLLYSVKNGAPDMSKPNKIKVEVNVNYKKTTDANAVAASDKLTFNLTAPANPTFAGESGTDFDAAIAKLSAKLSADVNKTYQQEIEEQTGINTDRNLTWVWRQTGTDWWKNSDYTDWISELENASDETAAITLFYQEEAKGHLRDIIRWYLGGDCGIDIEGAKMEIEAGETNFKLPTVEADGLIKIKVTFTNGVAESTGSGNDGDDTQENSETDPAPSEPAGKTHQKQVVTFTVKLSKFAARAEDVETKLESYTPAVTDATTENDIKTAVEELLTSMDLTNIRIQVSMEPAGENKVNITITINDLLGETKTVAKNAVTVTATPAD